MYPNRVVCCALDEMRKLLKKLDVYSMDRYKSVQALIIEEVQTMVNRMEASLHDGNDFEKMLIKRSKLKREVKKLEREVDALKEVTATEDSLMSMDARSLREKIFGFDSDEDL